MGAAKRKIGRRRVARKRSMPAERWVVFGTDRHGDRFASECATIREAEAVASKVNARGGLVDVRREVWSGSAAAYRTFLEPR